MEKSKFSIILFAGIALAYLAISAYAVPPKVIRTIPENGDQNVDPGLRNIRIEFDQNMNQGGMSICGSGPSFPKTAGKPKWINKKTLVMRVKLQPNHEYELSANSQSYKNFKNVQGESAVVYPIKFKTTTAGEKSSTSTKSPSLLLQEGIYAEETEGDLEKAIGLYEQVLEEYREVERFAARATYQLGMCHLKKGENDTAADYFQKVVDYYPKQKRLVKKAQTQLEKISPVNDIIAKSFVIHYKAVDQSKDGLKLLNKNHPKGVRTHHASRYRKNGEMIDSICTDNETGKDKIVAAINNSSELELIKVDSPAEATMTQELHNTIDADGLIHFKSPNRISNNNFEPITTNRFINSDFVALTKMYEEDGTPIPFETTHEGNIYRYRITFNKPIMPGESFVYYTEGTMSGLVRPVPGNKEAFRYFMVHSPSVNQPVLRIETFLLPEGAVFISTSTPNIQKTEKDGRIEIRVEEVVPANGSIATEFQYKLFGDRRLQLEPAPWVDGEVMEVRLKRPAGGEYGTIIYSAQRNTLNGDDTWQIISHMYVTEGSISQYTFVEAAVESFIPVYGQTTNWMGDFAAEYNDGNVKLTAGPEGKKSTRDIPVQTIAYDNEQALYLIRRMPLAENYEGSFPIFSVQGGSVIECRINVLATEDITVEAGTFTCYKTDLSIYSGGMRALQHTLWFSADEHKYLVKYDVGGTATMELEKVWRKDKNEPLIFENTEPDFSVTVPGDWRFYNYGTAGQPSLQLIAPEVKAWSTLVWQKRGTDPDSDSAMTIAKADYEKLKGFFENYTDDESSWKEYQISGLEAARYFATYQEKGKQMVEYRTYILGESLVYWFVFRIEKDKFEASKAEFDSIISSFKANAR